MSGMSHTCHEYAQTDSLEHPHQSSLRSRRLEVVGTRKKGRARRRHARGAKLSKIKQMWHLQMICSKFAIEVNPFFRPVGTGSACPEDSRKSFSARNLITWQPLRDLSKLLKEIKTTDLAQTKRAAKKRCTFYLRSKYICERFEPRSRFKRLSLIVRVGCY